METPRISLTTSNFLATGTNTLAHTLRYQAEQHPTAPFLIFEDAQGHVNRFTYAEMEQRAGRMKHILRTYGVSKGETFHVHLSNCPEFFDCWFASAALGAIMVPTNPLSTADELGYILYHAECKLSITQPDLLPALVKAQSSNDRFPILLARTEEAIDNTWLLSRLLASAPDTPDDLLSIEPLDPVAILYTSGTTSRPKGVLVTNANYLHVGEVVAQHLRVRPDDRWLIVLPLFHGNAQYYSTMSALVSSASIALVERFSASQWGSQAARHEATLGSLFAAPIRMILAKPPTALDGKNLLRATMFAQNITPEQVEAFERRFSCPLLQIYGMTETIAPATMNPLYGMRRNDSIGRPTHGTVVRVVTEERTDVPVGDVGELLVYGEPGRTLMTGYYKNAEETARAIQDGWLHTGDNVRVDENGYLYFVDRGKDMIKRAGENIAASEVERVVNLHPAVFESAAIGIPDAIRDEAIKVYIVLRDEMRVTEEDMLLWCSERLAKFKVPSILEFVEELPRTSVGKIQKHLLRQRNQSTQR